MSSILWVLGAGASYHLGMPLLNGFPAFFQELWERFPENRKDFELATTMPSSIEILNRNPDKNIEQLLASGSPLNDESKAILKRAIRRGFERRNLGRILKYFGRHGKLGPYSRLLGLMHNGDAVVNFNYDNALETPLCLALGDFSALNTSELDSAQMRYLTGGDAAQHWIPSDCLGELGARTLEYAPDSAFADAGGIAIGNGIVRIPLIKIHGSVNWFQSHGLIRIGVPEDRSMPPLIVYPEAEKPELMRQPYAAIVQAALTALERCSNIVVIGYSFPPSDCASHPFVSELVRLAAQKEILAVDPNPNDMLVETIGRNGIVQATFEEVMQHNANGASELQREIAMLRTG